MAASVLRAIASSENSVACPFYAARFVIVAPTVISWNTQYFVGSQTYYDFIAACE
jgi:hypothetical protein